MLSREIEIFRVVMTSGSATRAAKLLGMSQPAVSMSLQRLEKLAGVALFQRIGGKLHPTHEATALFNEVQRHFIGMEVIEHRIRSLAQFGSPRIRIASFPGLGAGFMPRVLGDLAAQDARQMISLQVTGSQEVRSLVLRDEVELGIAAKDVSVSGVEHAFFAHYFGIIALPAGHQLAGESVLTPKQLSRFPFVALPPDDVISRRVEAIFRSHGLTMETAVETSYTFSQCEMVRNGLGVAIINPVTAVDYLHAGLVFRPFSEAIRFTALTMWPAGRPLVPFVRQMLGAMRIRMDRDIHALKVTMPEAGRDVSLHQFHVDDSDA